MDRANLTNAIFDDARFGKTCSLAGAILRGAKGLPIVPVDMIKDDQAYAFRYIMTQNNGCTVDAYENGGRGSILRSAMTAPGFTMVYSFAILRVKRK